MSKWTELLLNFPEGATHVDLIFPNQMYRNINFIGGCYQDYFWRKTETSWYKFDSYKRKYRKRNYLEGNSTPWRIRSCKPTGYLMSREGVEIMVKMFEVSGDD